MDASSQYLARRGFFMPNDNIGYPKLFIGGAVGREGSPAAPTVNNFVAAKKPPRLWDGPMPSSMVYPSLVFPPQRVRSANDQSP